MAEKEGKEKKFWKKAAVAGFIGAVLLAAF
jgi:hypothetical protein